MFLSEDEIREKSAELFDDGYDPEFVKQACYDLRIGNEVFLPEKQVPTLLDLEEPYVVLPPGQFALIKTFEKVYVPAAYVAFISVRSRFKFQGLINISGFHVDPTYRGHLIFAVQNVGPNDVRLQYKESAFMIMWAKLQPPYKGRPRPEGYEHITLEQMAQLGGPSITLAKLNKKVESLDLALKIYGGFAIAAFLAMLGLLLKVIFNAP